MAWTDKDLQDNSGNVPITVEGVCSTVAPETPFKKRIGEIIAEKGWSSYKVIVNGEEIYPEDAPEDFTGLHSVKITKYDEAGK